MKDTTMKTKACLGGFCHLREKCAHHHSPDRYEDPSERLCTPGAERAMFFVPVADSAAETAVEAA
jgi:hypothetical protein